jgi:GntR family transcriptional regulator
MADEPDPKNDNDPRKYMRLAADLRAEIADGTLPPGRPTPSRVQLAAETGWSPLTCVKALRLLASEGLLTRYPGKGYYVNQPH